MGDANDDDQVLLSRWREGDARAGDLLCRRHGAMIQRFFEVKVAPNDVADLIQHCFLEAVGSLTKPDREVRSVRAYLFGIARRVFFKYLSERRKTGFDPLEDSLTAMDPTLSSQLFLKRRIEWLDLAISSLPLELNMLVEARRVGLGGPELAEMFGIPEGTVRSRLAKAIVLLKGIAAPITSTELALDVAPRG